VILLFDFASFECCSGSAEFACRLRLHEDEMGIVRAGVSLAASYAVAYADFQEPVAALILMHLAEAY
jgi:hypothetical protein